MHSFRNMFVAGEHCDKETMEWTKKVFDCPVLDNWWQTGRYFSVSQCSSRCVRPICNIVLKCQQHNVNAVKVKCMLY